MAIVLEYMDGGTLADVLKKVISTSLLCISAGMLEALAHSRFLCHACCMAEGLLQTPSNVS